MNQTYTIRFIHRINEDGSIDSICRDCFLTIATARSRSDLEVQERQHACEPMLVERYAAYKKLAVH
jgi:hypothetical protein